MPKASNESSSPCKKEEREEAPIRMKPHSFAGPIIQTYYLEPKKREISGAFCGQRYSWTKVLQIGLLDKSYALAFRTQNKPIQPTNEEKDGENSHLLAELGYSATGDGLLAIGFGLDLDLDHFILNKMDLHDGEFKTSRHSSHKIFDPTLALHWIGRGGSDEGDL